jgi:endonuclease/exonuclease/phosphatase family metal-dependent hydrolase
MQRLHLLSYNIQAGIQSRRYGDYVTHSWKHLLPHPERQENLARMVPLLRGYDMVGLQEVDAGSLRSAFVDQIEYLAQSAQFPFWYKQVNRNLGRLAQHSNGLLSRLRPARVIEHKLPGGIPGRGAVVAEFPTSDGGTLAVCIVHLALGWRARRRQLGYLIELVEREPYLVLMGDFNCDCSSRPLRSMVSGHELRGLDCELKTFPSWRPRRNLDHILLSRPLEVLEAKVIDYALSDHLPLSMVIALPRGVELIARPEPRPQSWI